MPRPIVGDVILLFVTLCWGLSFPCVENAVQAVDPTVFVTVRFFLAALLLLPILLFSEKKHCKVVLIAGLILGACNAIVYVSQSIGLQSMTSAEAAFITSINVVLVPFILPFFALGKPRKQDIIGSLLCFLGLAFLLGHDLSHVNIGYAWVLLTAIFVAISIAYLQKVTKKEICLNFLAFYQIAFTSLFTLIFTVHKDYHGIMSLNVVWALFFCAFFCTSLTLWLQTKYQHYTTASRAAMIFCFEPVFAGIAGYILNGETLSWHAWLCGGFILFGITIASDILPLHKKF
jgi:drug/metabolite transporter (DMT)-like permease